MFQEVTRGQDDASVPTAHLHNPRPYDASHPQICIDEGGKTLQAQTHEPLPMQVGKIEREDYEYEREGFCSVFVAVEPLSGKRIIQPRARRTKADWAYFMRELIEVHYPQAEQLVVVMDNLNTHSPAYFYEVFEPEEAWRLAQKLEVHHTPVHGSWLNMAEIELSVLARQALSGRLASLQAVQERVAAWQHRATNTRLRFLGALRLLMLASSSSVSIRQSKLDRALWGDEGSPCPRPLALRERIRVYNRPESPQLSS